MDAKRKFFLAICMRNKRRRDQLQKLILLQQLRNEQRMVQICSAMLLKQQLRFNKRRKRSQCRRHERTSGCWSNMRNNYSGERFKKAMRVSSDNFLYIIDYIKMDIQKQTLTEEPISLVPCSTAKCCRTRILA